MQLLSESVTSKAGAKVTFKAKEWATLQDYKRGNKLNLI